MSRNAIAVALAPFICLVANVATAQTISSTSESNPFPGVRIVEGRTSNPGTDFHAAYISLCSDSVHVDASSYDGYSTSGGWASDVGAELAVNGDFFSASPRLHVYGDAVGSGNRWALNRIGLGADYTGDWYHEKYGWIAFGEDWVDFTNTEWVKNNTDSLSGWKPGEVAPDPPAGTKALVSGFPQLVVDGIAHTCSNITNGCFRDRGDMDDRHPRTAMGLTRDKQTFILAVVDGRRSSSVGMYGAELAKLMKDLGAYTAFNLDGGGSSQMWVRGEGTINRPSDGSPRSVVNHWGIFAGGGNSLPTIPGHCDNRWDGLVHHLTGQTQRASDLNGDGMGDVCIRSADGISCSLFQDGEFGPEFDGPALADDSGWSDVSNYSTIRWGDVNGDGLSDVCARANAGMRCWASNGTGFGSAITGPALNDESGFHRPEYSATIRLADVTGDGMDDICARWNDGVRCYPSTGDGFGEAIAGPGLADDNGWSAVQHYGTIRTGDVTGDGLDDICARGNAGVRCWPSTGTGFDNAFNGPEWSNANGWDNYRYWSTIRLIDLDDDGRHDICGRSPDGLRCALSTGTGFGAAIVSDAMSDASGWTDYDNFSSIRFADVTGDGNLDVCGRSNDGYWCWPFDGSDFGQPIVTELLRNASGWTDDTNHRTADFVDVDGDGLADLCARSDAGMFCWRSTGDAFEEMLIDGPAWSDAEGFNEKRYYSTMRLLGRVRPAPVEPTPGDMGTAGNNGTPDAGTAGNNGNGSNSGGNNGGGGDDAGATPYLEDDSVVVNADGGCGCTTSTPASSGVLAFLAGLLLIGTRRRRS